MGKLIFKFGVMGSGKTADLLIKGINHEENHIMVGFFKPKIDTREEQISESNGVISSRIKGLSHVCQLVDDDKLFWTNQQVFYDDYHYHTTRAIYIDECQFLSDKQLDYIINNVDTFPFDVIMYGLRTDFRGNMFPAIIRIMAMADEIIEIPAKCSCGNNAIINARVDKDGEYIKKGNQIEIGGNDKYIPVCRVCFMKSITPNKKNHIIHDLH